MDIFSLSRQYGIHLEEKTDGGFPDFFQRMLGRRLLLLADQNTQSFALPLLKSLSEHHIDADLFSFPSLEPVADEPTVQRAISASQGYDYLLSVGSGTLNDIGKYCAFLTKKESGCYATAPSMDGFSSGVTPLIEGGRKITRTAQTAKDVLLDYDVLTHAPSQMKGAGVGDILAKFGCLADWKISHRLYGEAYREGAASLMYTALQTCDQSVSSILRGDREGVSALMEALLISGYAMVMAGNSRPASGAEHHMSHFLEMDFLRRGKPIPLHGIKVGLGTMVSLWLYEHLLTAPYSFEGVDVVREEAARLPSPDHVESVLAAFSCPTRFSQIDVSKDTMRDMLRRSYQIRDRFTVMTLYVQQKLLEGVIDEIMDRYYQ
ncbi:MAG: sn-glycerol-1-phosphate dehydrogenase [Christensenellaceae bacterium]